MQFVVSGTQTGKLARLDARHYCRVVDYDFRGFSLIGSGRCRPSSESLTHASTYEAVPDIQFIVHVHHHQLWQELLLHKSVMFGTQCCLSSVCVLDSRPIPRCW